MTRVKRSVFRATNSRDRILSRNGRQNRRRCDRLSSRFQSWKISCRRVDEANRSFVWHTRISRFITVPCKMPFNCFRRVRNHDRNRIVVSVFSPSASNRLHLHCCPYSRTIIISYRGWNDYRVTRVVAVGLIASQRNVADPVRNCRVVYTDKLRHNCFHSSKKNTSHASDR